MLWLSMLSINGSEPLADMLGKAMPMMPSIGAACGAGGGARGWPCGGRQPRARGAAGRARIDAYHERVASLVDHLAEHLGGHLDAAHREDVDALVRLDLPAAVLHGEASARPQTTRTFHSRRTRT